MNKQNSYMGCHTDNQLPPHIRILFDYENKTLIVNFQKLFLLWNSCYKGYIYLLLKENFAYLSHAIKHH